MKKDADIIPVGIINFGSKNIDIRFNKNSKRYYLEYDNKRKEIGEQAFDELFKNAQADINNVPRNDFITYGMILHESKPFPRNSGQLVAEILNAIGKATSDKTIKERVGNLYDILTPLSYHSLYRFKQLVQSLAKAVMD